MATVKGALPELRAYSIYLANVQKLKSYRVMHFSPVRTLKSCTHKVEGN